MISITTVIQTHLKTPAESVVSGTKRFIDLLTSFHGDSRREIQFLLCTAHLVMFKISVGRDLKNPTISFHGQNPTPASMVQSQLIQFLLCTAHLVMFKISVGRDLKSPTISFRGQNPTDMIPISPALHFLFPIHISFAIVSYNYLIPFLGLPHNFFCFFSTTFNLSYIFTKS